MSGGSMEYLCHRVRDASFSTHTPERKAFAEHLQLVADALHDIEWVDSGDYGPGDESLAIRKCIGQSAVLAAAVETARKAHTMLGEEIERAASQSTEPL